MGVGARGGMEAARRRQAGPRGTKNGPVSCPGFVARGTRKSKNRDQKTGQFSGPENGPKNGSVFRTVVKDPFVKPKNGHEFGYGKRTQKLSRKRCLADKFPRTPRSKKGTKKCVRFCSSRLWLAARRCSHPTVFPRPSLHTTCPRTYTPWLPKNSSSWNPENRKFAKMNEAPLQIC